MLKQKEVEVLELRAEIDGLKVDLETALQESEAAK